jgi:hypothetical protein
VVLITVGWTEAGSSSRAAPHASRQMFYVSLVALVAVQLLIMNTRWLVNDSFLDEPPERSVVLSAPPMSFTTTAEFADQIALRGYDVDRSEGTINLTLYWQALTQPQHAYTVFAHALNSIGEQVGQQDSMPVDDQSPTSCWQPGEYVLDRRTLSITSAEKPLTVEVGLYLLQTGERLARSDAQGDSAALSVP